MIFTNHRELSPSCKNCTNYREDVIEVSMDIYLAGKTDNDDERVEVPDSSLPLW